MVSNDGDVTPQFLGKARIEWLPPDSPLDDQEGHQTDEIMEAANPSQTEGPCAIGNASKLSLQIGRRGNPANTVIGRLELHFNHVAPAIDGSTMTPLSINSQHNAIPISFIRRSFQL